MKVYQLDELHDDGAMSCISPPDRTFSLYKAYGDCSPE